MLLDNSFDSPLIEARQMSYMPISSLSELFSSRYEFKNHHLSPSHKKNIYYKM